MLPRRVVETKGISIDREILLRVVVYEPGVKKEDVKKENNLTKRHFVLIPNGNGYEFK